MTPNEQMLAYTEAVRSGLYARQSGLVGKYDNVRRLWEDEIIRFNLRPHLHRVIDRCRAGLRRVRILDLGCGGADGYELLMGIRDRDADLKQLEVDLLTPEVLGLYHGVDLNPDLLAQARAVHGHRPKVRFSQVDFTHEAALSEDGEPYDVYFSSYGTCSHHNEDATFVTLLANIARRTRDYALIHCDWLGRYSYEWQTLWTHDPNAYRNMDYVVSYIYEKDERERRREQLQHLMLRVMSRPEIDALVKEASEQAGVPIRPLCVYDRSIFTGRHMDTGEYNPHARPIRQAVNSLHEVNRRTDLGSLLVDYAPREGFGHINSALERLQMCWNDLVAYTAGLLEAYDEEARGFRTALPAPPAAAPPILVAMRDRMRRVVEGTGWYGMGLPRENIIEPQLGYALRAIMSALQPAQGCGHGLVGIYEVDKRPGAAAGATTAAA